MNFDDDEAVVEDIGAVGLSAPAPAPVQPMDQKQVQITRMQLELVENRLQEEEESIKVIAGVVNEITKTTAAMAIEVQHQSEVVDQIVDTIGISNVHIERGKETLYEAEEIQVGKRKAQKYRAQDEAVRSDSKAYEAAVAKSELSNNKAAAKMNKAAERKRLKMEAKAAKKAN